MVSDPLKDKGRLRLFVCGPSGRYQIMRLDRDRTEANQALDRARRGDVVKFSEAISGDTRVGQEVNLSLEAVPKREA